jgi:hypothetical protein
MVKNSTARILTKQKKQNKKRELLVYNAGQLIHITTLVSVLSLS